MVRESTRAQFPGSAKTRSSHQVEEFQRSQPGRMLAGREKPKKRFPSSVERKVKPHAYYRIGGPIIPARDLPEGILPANAQEIRLSLPQRLLFELNLLIKHTLGKSR